MRAKWLSPVGKCAKRRGRTKLYVPIGPTQMEREAPPRPSPPHVTEPCAQTHHESLGPVLGLGILNKGRVTEFNTSCKVYPFDYIVGLSREMVRDHDNVIG